MFGKSHVGKSLIGKSHPSHKKYVHLWNVCFDFFLSSGKDKYKVQQKYNYFKRPSLLHLENDILEIPIGQNWKNWSVRHKPRFWQLVFHKIALARFSNWTAKVPIFNPEVNIY